MSNEILGVIRASSWADLFDCAYRWKFVHLDHLSARSSHQAAIGSAVHHGAAFFDGAAFRGESVTVEEACEQAKSHLSECEGAEEIDWTEIPREKAEQVAANLVRNYCRIISPERNWVAVESRCDGLDIETDHGIVRVTGTIDRVEDTGEGWRVSDLKSGKSAVKSNSMEAAKKAHGIQLGIYTLMAEVDLGKALTAPAEIIGLNCTEDCRIGTTEFEDVKTPLFGTEEEPGLIDMAARMLKEGFFPPNPRSMMCGKKWCAGYDRCHFHS